MHLFITLYSTSLMIFRGPWTIRSWKLASQHRAVFSNLHECWCIALNRTVVVGYGCQCASIYHTRFIMPKWSLLVGLALPTLSGAMARCCGERRTRNSHYCIAHFVTHQFTHRAKRATQKIPDRNDCQCPTQRKVKKTGCSFLVQTTRCCRRTLMSVACNATRVCSIWHRWQRT